MYAIGAGGCLEKCSCYMEAYGIHQIGYMEAYGIHQIGYMEAYGIHQIGYTEGRPV